MNRMACELSILYKKAREEREKEMETEREKHLKVTVRMYRMDHHKPMQT